MVVVAAASKQQFQNTLLLSLGVNRKCIKLD